MRKKKHLHAIMKYNLDTEIPFAKIHSTFKLLQISNSVLSLSLNTRIITFKFLYQLIKPTEFLIIQFYKVFFFLLFVFSISLLKFTIFNSYPLRLDRILCEIVNATVFFFFKLRLIKVYFYGVVQ